jgi:hypothetical protein
MYMVLEILHFLGFYYYERQVFLRLMGLKEEKNFVFCMQ